jgi:hypothetical protein
VAPTGTVAEIVVAEVTTKVAGVALNTTDVVHPKFVPVMVTLDPTAPPDGVKDVMVGAAAAATTKFTVLTALPSGSITVSGPVPVAPPGTSTVTDVSDTELSELSVTPPGNVTPVAADPEVNPEPVTTTDVVARPHVGVNELMVAADAGSAVKSTPTTPSTSASALARADTFFFGNLIRAPPFWVAGKLGALFRFSRLPPDRRVARCSNPILSSAAFLSRTSRRVCPHKCRWMMMFADHDGQVTLAGMVSVKVFPFPVGRAISSKRQHRDGPRIVEPGVPSRYVSGGWPPRIQVLTRNRRRNEPRVAGFGEDLLSNRSPTS